jgi:hypothetical protein
LKTQPTQASEYFTPERIAAQRGEIEAQGLVADDFLGTDPDCPVFGLNLACAYPFPPTVEEAYSKTAFRLAALDEGVYVYPFWETHITIITFLNFSLHRRPDAKRLEELRAFTAPILDAMREVFRAEPIAPFELHFRAPVLTRKAGILPIGNPTGEIPRLRQRALQVLEANKELHGNLTRLGLNVPGIIHSTIMRFKKVPSDFGRFTTGFDAVAASAPPFTIPIRELYLTAETKPYMRSGEILHHFPLEPVLNFLQN